MYDVYDERFGKRVAIYHEKNPVIISVYVTKYELS